MLNCKWLRIVLRMLYEAVFVTLIFYFFTVLFLREAPGFFGIAGLFLLYILSYGIREIAPTQILLLLLHLVLMPGIYFLPFSDRMCLALMGVQLYLTISVLVYAHKGAVLKPLSDIPWPSFLVCSLIYIVSLVSDQVILMRAAYIVTILLLLIYYMMLYVEGLTKYMDSAKDVSGLPLKRMVNTNTKIISIILLILIFSLFIGWMFGSDGITDVILAVCQKLVQGIFWLIGFLLSILWKDSEVIDWNYEDGDFVIPETAAGWGMILEIVLMAAFIAGMVFAFYRILRKVIRLLLKPRSYEEDMVEAAEQDKTLIKEKSRGKSNRFHTLSLSEKARRYYRLRIMKHKASLTLNAQCTCRDIQDQIEQEGLDDTKDLTELYSEIRYGTLEVDKGLLKKIKALAGTMNRG